MEDEMKNTGQETPAVEETYTEQDGRRGPRYADAFEEFTNRKAFGNYSWGVVLLAAGCLWAVYELVRSILYFF